MATMKDVARRAGVSTATVSRVINNTAYVEPVTRERVEKAMREFNYHRTLPRWRWRKEAAICWDC